MNNRPRNPTGHRMTQANYRLLCRIFHHYIPKRCRQPGVGAFDWGAAPSAIVLAAALDKAKQAACVQAGPLSPSAQSHEQHKIVRGSGARH